jgi:hypothetical protein
MCAETCEWWWWWWSSWWWCLGVSLVGFSFLLLEEAEAEEEEGVVVEGVGGTFRSAPPVALMYKGTMVPSCVMGVHCPLLVSGANATSKMRSNGI